LKELARWARTFQVWQYSVSHSNLLLRSYEPDVYDTRVDVFFGGVELVRLKPNYDELRIFEGGADDRSSLLAGVPELLNVGRLYVLNDPTFYVIARRCAWHEDRGNHHAPSKFGPFRGSA
jgi:hypothetical protein